ncbi:MAG TPA: helix-turn-helix domain-containing protein [Paludibacteraceae bacterium]|nr:helix-turn-helix domain-containing protein [Paludibacteraceae bacterium]
MKHLTVEQGYTIWVIVQQGLKRKDIALALGKDKSVVSCEPSRNSDNRRSLPITAKSLPTIK